MARFEFWHEDKLCKEIRDVAYTLGLCLSYKPNLKDSVIRQSCKRLSESLAACHFNQKTKLRVSVISGKSRGDGAHHKTNIPVIECSWPKEEGHDIGGIQLSWDELDDLMLTLEKLKIQRSEAKQ